MMDLYKQGLIMLFNKPVNWSSFDVVQKVHYLTRAKVGHAGTLDPLASGLLILCTGNFTKRIIEFQDLEKEYTGTMKLGEDTASFDRETSVEKSFDISNITQDDIYNASKKFSGEIFQMPPIHSAKQKDGRRYYKMARSGEHFEPELQKVILHQFEITKIEIPFIGFKIICGKGFYVRSLVNDFGKALNNGCHLTSLCRTRIGSHLLTDAWDIEEFSKSIKLQKELAENGSS